MQTIKEKLCKGCCEYVDISSFRIRDKNGYKYTSSKCKSCEAAYTREYTAKHRNDPEYRKRCQDRANKFRAENLEKVKGWVLNLF